MLAHSRNNEGKNGMSRAKLDEDQIVGSDELLTIAEVAAYLKLSRRTAWRWCKSGRLPAFKVGHQWRVAQRDLEEFIRWRGKFAL